MPRAKVHVELADGEKKCTRCKKVLPEEDFINSHHRIGSECKTCQEYRKIKDAESRARRLAEEEANVQEGFKVCKQCKKPHPEDDFMGAKGKPVLTCKLCREYKSMKVKELSELRKKTEERIMGADGKQQCKRCGCWHDPSDFIGVRGKEVTACHNCRENMRKADENPERYQKKIERNNETKAYIKYRAKKKEEDADAFREHNREMNRKWTEETHNGALKRLTQNAKIRSIPLELSKEEMIKMFEASCAYCGFKDEKKLNGIDRMNPTKAYTKENAVTCCGDCNIMKKCLDPITFKRRCVHITEYMEILNRPYSQVWGECNKRDTNYTIYQKNAEQRNLPFELTKDEFILLIQQVCHYCGYDESRTRGIDRKESSIGYTNDNCVPCCRECNIMKGSTPYAEFAAIAKRVTLWKEEIKYDGPELLKALPSSKVFNAE